MIRIGSNCESGFFRGLGSGGRPGRGDCSRCGRFCWSGCRHGGVRNGGCNDGVGVSRSGRALLITSGEFAVSRGFVGIPGIGVNVLQCAAADAGFGETRGAGVQRGQALVQAQIGGRLGQGGQERAESLGRHVVGNEKFGVGKCGA